MRYVKLGTSGLDVSPVAIGAMTYGEPGRGHPVWSLGKGLFLLRGSYSNHMLRTAEGWRIEKLVQHVSWAEDTNNP